MVVISPIFSAEAVSDLRIRFASDVRCRHPLQTLAAMLKVATGNS
jgi:hypothetical protein